MPEDQNTVWVRDHYGRIGKLHDDTITFAAGSKKASAVPYHVITNNPQIAQEYQSQLESMWEVVIRYDKLNRSVLSKLLRGVSRESLHYITLLNDVGVQSMCEAVLLYDSSKGDMSQYLRSVLTRAYRRALSTKGDSQVASLEDVSDELGVNCKELGLFEDKSLLSGIVTRAGLSQGEIELLMMRFDSQMSLRDIAQRINVASPQTVANMLTRIMERCRASL